jgi:hypothetical protein
MRILVQMVDPVRVDQRGSTLDTMNDIALLEQQFGKIGAILSGYASD